MTQVSWPGLDFYITKATALIELLKEDNRAVHQWCWMRTRVQRDTDIVYSNDHIKVLLLQIRNRLHSSCYKRNGYGGIRSEGSHSDLYI